MSEISNIDSRVKHGKKKNVLPFILNLAKLPYIEVIEDVLHIHSCGLTPAVITMFLHVS